MTAVLPTPMRGSLRRPGPRAAPHSDAMIPSIPRSRRWVSRATRNVGEFGDCGIVVIDPWQ